MYISISLKTPPISLVNKGKLDADTVKDLAKGFSGNVLHFTAPDGRPMLIPVSTESNISYIKEISAEDYKRMEEEKKKLLAQREKGSIVKPDVMHGIPGRNFQKGRGN